MYELYKKPAYLLLLLCVLHTTGQAASLYEDEIAETLFQRTDQGEPVWLYADGQRYLALYSQPLSDMAQGAVIVVHGMGAHPDWPEVVAPVRNRLPAGGWATLAIQMPVLEPGEPLADYGKTISQSDNRIRAAIQFLSDRKFLNIVIIGHGFGAVAAANYLAGGQTSVQAFVGVSMRNYEFLNPRLYLDEMLEGIMVPVLDIFGSRDFTEVTGDAERRRLQARRDNREDYSQVSIEGADHSFTGVEQVLVRQIRDWLDKAAPGVQVFLDDEINMPLQQEARPETRPE